MQYNRFAPLPCRYKEVVYQEEQYEPPKEILDRLKALEAEIQQELVELEGML